MASGASSDSSSASPDSDGKTKASAALRSEHGQADEVLHVPGGTIRFYSKNNIFTATCSNHANCVRTRQSTAAKVSIKTPNGKAKGRPLGHLVAWLAMEKQAAVDSKANHWNQAAVAEYCAYAVRLDKRLSLDSMDGGPEMLQHERPQRDGEGDEPAGLA